MKGSEKQVKWAMDIKEMIKEHYNAYKQIIDNNEHSKNYVAMFYDIDDIAKTYEEIIAEEDAKKLINIYSGLKRYMVEDYKKKAADNNSKILYQIAFAGADLIMKYKNY